MRSFSESIQRKKTKATAWRTMASSPLVCRGLCHLPWALWLSLSLSISLSHHIPPVILGTPLIAAYFGFFGLAVLFSTCMLPSSPHRSLSHIVPALMYCLLRELISDHLHPVRFPTPLSLSISSALLYFAAQDL